MGRKEIFEILFTGFVDRPIICPPLAAMGQLLVVLRASAATDNHERAVLETSGHLTLLNLKECHCVLLCTENELVPSLPANSAYGRNARTSAASRPPLHPTRRITHVRIWISGPRIVRLSFIRATAVFAASATRTNIRSRILPVIISRTCYGLRCVVLILTIFHHPQSPVCICCTSLLARSPNCPYQAESIISFAAPA